MCNRAWAQLRNVSACIYACICFPSRSLGGGGVDFCLFLFVFVCVFLIALLESTPNVQAANWRYLQPLWLCSQDSTSPTFSHLNMKFQIWDFLYIQPAEVGTWRRWLGLPLAYLQKKKKVICPSPSAKNWCSLDTTLLLDNCFTKSETRSILTWYLAFKYLISFVIPHTFPFYKWRKIEEIKYLPGYNLN